MKGFQWLLILFIGMISLTGFSSTATDLTTDSIDVFVPDNDVGVLNTSIVVNLQFSVINSLAFNKCADKHIKALTINPLANSKDFMQTDLRLPLLVPWQVNYKTLYANKELQNNRARERLTSKRA